MIIHLKDEHRKKIAKIDLSTFMFADLPTYELYLEEDNELVGFAVAVDEKGNPGWLDFVVAGGRQWQYREGETCKQYHSIKFTNELINSKEGLVDCNLCKVPIKNIS